MKGTNNFGDAGALPLWERGVTVSLETHSCPTCVIITIYAVCQYWQKDIDTATAVTTFIPNFVAV